MDGRSPKPLHLSLPCENLENRYWELDFLLTPIPALGKMSRWLQAKSTGPGPRHDKHDGFDDPENQSMFSFHVYLLGDVVKFRASFSMFTCQPPPREQHAPSDQTCARILATFSLNPDPDQNQEYTSFISDVACWVYNLLSRLTQFCSLPSKNFEKMPPRSCTDPRTLNPGSERVFVHFHAFQIVRPMKMFTKVILKSLSNTK